MWSAIDTRAVQPMDSLTHGGMSTENLWNILKGPKDAPLAYTYWPSYVDVSPLSCLLESRLPYVRAWADLFRSEMPPRLTTKLRYEVLKVDSLFLPRVSVSITPRLKPDGYR